MINKYSVKLFGVPGSGKTSKCLEYIKKFLKEGYTLNDITFTTYTKAGMNSIKEKLNNEGLFLPKNNYFKTLNSLTWHLSGFSHKFPSEKEKRDFFKSIGFTTEPEEDKKSEMERITQIYNSILNKTAKSIQDLSQNELKSIIHEILEDKNSNEELFVSFLNGVTEYSNWLIEKDYKDYSDSLINVLKEKIDIFAPILIVDEAQDLSYLQSEIVSMWVKEFNKDIFIICGDDDQTVHSWADASPNFLLNLNLPNMKKEILEITHRLPKNITLLCNKISNRIKNREIKSIVSNKENRLLEYLSLDYPNLITFLSKTLNMNKKNYLLFRTNKLRKKIANLLFTNTNIPYGFINDQSFENSRWTAKLMAVSNALNKIDKNIDLTNYEFKKLIELLPSKNNCLKSGIKTKLKKIEKEIISVKEFISFTILVGQTTIDNSKKDYTTIKFSIKEWLLRFINYKGKNKTNEDIAQNELYKEKFRSLNNLFEIKIEKGKAYINHNIELGTFHSSKGLEADNVFVFLGTSSAFQEINDSEYRCFYVACSRTKNNLYIMGHNLLANNSYESYLEDEVSSLLLDYRKR